MARGEGSGRHTPSPCSTCADSELVLMGFHAVSAAAVVTTAVSSVG